MMRKLAPSVLLAAMVGVTVMWRSRLPEEISTRWGIGTAPSASMPPLAELALLCGIFALLWATAARRPGAGAYALLGLIAGVHVMLLWANLDRGSWMQARPLSAQLVAFPLGGAACGAALGWRPGSLPKGNLHPVWTGRAIARPWLVAITLFAIAMASLALLKSSSPGFSLVFAATIAVATLSFWRIEVVVSRAAFTVRFGPWRWPAKHIALGEIASAQATMVRSMSYGYRGFGRRVAVIVRSGPAIELTTTDGGTFIVTVDHPDRGVEVLRDLLAGDGGRDV